MFSSVTLHLAFVGLAVLHGGIWFQMEGLNSSWLMLSISCAFIARLMMKGREPGLSPWTRVMKYCAGTTERTNWGRCCGAPIALLFISKLLWGLVASVKIAQLWNSKNRSYNLSKRVSRTLILNSCWIQKPATLPSCVDLSRPCWKGLQLCMTQEGLRVGSAMLWEVPVSPAVGQQGCSQSTGLLWAAGRTSGRALFLSPSARTSFPLPSRLLLLTLGLPLSTAACPELARCGFISHVLF